MADVREIPDERRLQRRELTGELLVGKRLEQRLGPLPGPFEHERELRP